MKNEFKVLYICKDFIVFIKPFGIISEDNGKDNCVFAYIRKYLNDTGEKNTELYPVHRLDKETGGIMVIARNKTTASFLSKTVTDGQFKKTYTAEICGKIIPPSGGMTDLLFFDRQRNKTFTVKRERKGVKRAELEYFTEQETENGSIVKINLKTGRTHQIRVQFSSRGCPVIGDRKYGGGKSEFMHLWAGELVFPTESGEVMSFSVPVDFNKLRD